MFSTIKKIFSQTVIKTLPLTSRPLEDREKPSTVFTFNGCFLLIRHRATKERELWRRKFLIMGGMGRDLFKHFSFIPTNVLFPDPPIPIISSRSSLSSFLSASAKSFQTVFFTIISSFFRENPRSDQQKRRGLERIHSTSFLNLQYLRLSVVDSPLCPLRI